MIRAWLRKLPRAITGAAALLVLVLAVFGAASMLVAAPTGAEPPAESMPSWDAGSGRHLPAPLLYTHNGRLFRWIPGESAPEEISGHGWGRPLSPVIADASGDTFFFAAYRVDRSAGRVGVNINICNIFKQTPRGIEMVTKDWDVATSPDFSRDGRTLIFVSNHHAMLRQLMPTTVTTEIYIVRRPWLLPKRLTLDGGFKFNPRLSPDGERVVYMGINGAASGLYVYDITSREVHRIGPAGDYPTWTPDGAAVTYGVNGKLRTVAVTGDGHQGSESEALDVEPAGTYVSYPRWTDHGLVYSWSRGGRTGVSLWNPATRQSRVLVSGTGDFGGADLADTPGC